MLRVFFAGQPWCFRLDVASPDFLHLDAQAVASRTSATSADDSTAAVTNASPSSSRSAGGFRNSVAVKAKSMKNKRSDDGLQDGSNVLSSSTGSAHSSLGSLPGDGPPVGTALIKFILAAESEEEYESWAAALREEVGCLRSVSALVSEPSAASTPSSQQLPHPLQHFSPLRHDGLATLVAEPSGVEE
eukprot:SAG31_NODE_15688_length_743_cov_0.874224_1_plen_187_part_10